MGPGPRSGDAAPGGARRAGPPVSGMLALSSTQRIYLALGVTDLRRGFNGLYAMIQQQFGEDPVSGALYVFCNRRRDAVKIFGYADGGFWVCAKRLEQGTFRWPEVPELPAAAAAARTIPLPASAMQLLL